MCAILQGIVKIVISLVGPNSILDRSLVIHADPEDMGRGGRRSARRRATQGRESAAALLDLLTLKY